MAEQKIINTVKTQWNGKMQFSSMVNDHEVLLDAKPEHGGEGKGASPKQLMLSAFAGCTGMDVVSLCEKMRVPIDSLDIEITAELTTSHPKHYDKVHLIYKVKGTDLDKSKVEKAVQLSQEKYCGVSAMFRAFAAVTFEIVYV